MTQARKSLSSPSCSRFHLLDHTRQTSVSRKLEGCPSNQYALHPVHPSRSRAASQDCLAHSALSLCFSKFDSGPAAQVTRHLGNEDSWACLVPLNQNLPLTWTPGDYVHILVETLDPQHSFCEGLCHPAEWAFLLSGPPGISSWGPGLRSLLLLDLPRHRGPWRAIENGWSDWWFLPKSLFSMAWWGVLRAHSIALGTTETQPAKVRQHLPPPWPPPSPGPGGYSANICWGKQAIITVGRFFTSTCWPTAQCAPVQQDGLSSKSGTCVPKKVPATPSPATKISHLPNAGLWIFSWKVHLDSDFVKPGLRWSYQTNHDVNMVRVTEALFDKIIHRPRRKWTFHAYILFQAAAGWTKIRRIQVIKK